MAAEMEVVQVENLDAETVMAKLEGSREEMWGGGEYMRAKKRKLRDQFEDIGQEKTSEIFKGVSVYVNGWTQPNADEIKHLVHAHGGSYKYNLYGDSDVTHTIATNLPHSKIRKLKEGALVCTPAWVVDSVAAGHRLPEESYLLYRGQKKLEFIPQPPPTKEHELLNDTEVAEGALLTGPSALKSRPSLPQQYHTSRGAAFVSDYFTYSRLHHLSKWSTELREFTSRTLPQVDQKYPKLLSNSSSSSSSSLRGNKRRLIAHVDIDCFFVSVSLRERPHLRGRPVAVCHAKLPPVGNPGERHTVTIKPEGKPEEHLSCDGTSSKSENSPLPEHLLKSTSDIASCSYEAREAGVKNGMSVGEALKRCPDLQLVPYEFDKYHEVSKSFYTILMSYSSSLEPVSCDEAYLELTDYTPSVTHGERMIQELRDEVERATGCTVSAGVAHNMLLARMATRVAKPNGQHFLTADDITEFMSNQRVKDLPGVGYSTAAKLREMGVEMCGQLQSVPLTQLKSNFGTKTGQSLYDHSRGKDERKLKLASERKSISVDLNYGLRFQSQSEAESLLQNLTRELEKRASEAGVVGGTLTIKLMIRRPDAPAETAKFLGHGKCNNVSRSCQLLQPTANGEEFLKLSLRLLKQIRPQPEDIRGMGVQLTRLVSSSSSSSSTSSNRCTDLRTLLATSENSNSNPKQHEISGQEKDNLPPLPDLSFPAASPHPSSSLAGGARDLDETFNIDLPPVSQLDSSVLSALPPDLTDKILRSYMKKEEEEREKEKEKKEEEEKKDGVLLMSRTNGCKQSSPLKSWTEGGVGKRGRGKGKGRGRGGRGRGSPYKSPSKRCTRTVNFTESPIKQKLLSDFLPESIRDREENDHSHRLDKPLDLVDQPQQISDHHSVTPTSNVVTKEDLTTTSHEVTASTPVVNGDRLVAEFRDHIKGWVRESPAGPMERDLEIVTEDFIELCKRDVASLFVVIRGFRRMSLTSGVTNWGTAFNSLLEKVQDCIISLHKATLPIEPIPPAPAL